MLPGLQKTGPNKIYDFQLLKLKPVYARMDVFPIFITSCLIWYYHGSKIFDREELVPVMCLMAACTFHSLMFFINFWSADLNVLFCYYKLPIDSELANCSHIWVKIENKKQETIKKHIVPLQSESVQFDTKSTKLHTVYTIEVMKKRMIWNNSNKEFKSIPYPVKESIDFYKSAVGLKEKNEESKANMVWGNNSMKIPIPKFMDLYKEHLVAPFFVF